MVTFITFATEDRLQLQAKDAAREEERKLLDTADEGKVDLSSYPSGTPLTTVLESSLESSTLTSGSKPSGSVSRKDQVEKIIQQPSKSSRFFENSCNGITQTLMFGAVMISTCYAITLADK